MQKKPNPRPGVYRWDYPVSSPYLPTMKYDGLHWHYWWGNHWVKYTGRKKAIPGWGELLDGLRMGRLMWSRELPTDQKTSV